MIKNYLCFLLIFVSQCNVAQPLNCQKIKNIQQINSLYYSPENLRSDTFDVLHYDVHLEVDFSTSQIKGFTNVKVIPKMNSQSSVRLDLLKMTIDSIKVNNVITPYFYNDTLLNISFGSIKNIGDTCLVSVYYHGVPQVDPSGWGGFYFNGNYAFNLGVGFASVPHNFGRVWFPCFDNFVEKSLYDFYIITDTTKYAYCNGVLVSDTIVNGKRVRHWRMNQEIPSYLASVAVADYVPLQSVISTPSHTLPVIIAARASDTNAVKAAFVHLPNAVNIFENKYGLYRWDRVGYCMVPFNSGAMEHATNIAYPQLAIGNTNYEAPLMAHELSHHWWGDLVTCETQEDMWINEGMATYSEMIFLENLYGYSHYQSQLQSMNNEMIQFGNFKEQQYWAVSGVPAQYTYGDHVYKKGAIVAHNLRVYMGDSLFFNGLKYVLSQKAFQNMNSAEFQTLLENYSGINLNDFFNNWVFNGGYPVFSIDSAVYQNIDGTNYLAKVYIRQKLHGAPNFFDNVPIRLAFFNNNWTPYFVNAVLSGSTSVITTTLNFLPSFEILNYDKRLAYASVGDNQIIKNTGNMFFNNAKVSINVLNKGQDSSFMYIEHHFAAPDTQPIIQNGDRRYKFSNQHYWKITGKLSNGFYAKIRLNYNGNITYSGYGCMDTCLTSINADSIVVLYRSKTNEKWREVPFVKYPSGTKAGMLMVDSVKLGEYTFANKNGYYINVGVKENNISTKRITIYPNPSQQKVFLSTNISKDTDIYIETIDGKRVKKIRLFEKDKSINISDLSNGTYVLWYILDDVKYYGQFIKQ